MQQSQIRCAETTAILADDNELLLIGSEQGEVEDPIVPNNEEVKEH